MARLGKVSATVPPFQINPRKDQSIAMTNVETPAAGKRFSPPIGAKPLVQQLAPIEAIIAGTKTQVRIPFNDQPSPGKDFSILDVLNRRHLAHFSPWAVGDCIWIRETWALTPDRHDHPTQVIHKATPGEWKNNPFIKWQSPLTMPMEYARIFLQITEVRPQRLHEISSEDAMAEGIRTFTPGYVDFGSSRMFWFKLMWNAQQGASGPEFDLNPWVWAYSFKVLHIAQEVTLG